MAIRRKIGFLPEDFRFYEWLTASELLRAARAALRRLRRSELRERVPALIDLVGLTPHRDKRLQNFSKGMLQRIGLAQALIHEPELIFLDEPTSGLDPMGRRLVRDIIRAQRDRGATVFLNSHLLSEIEITCDEVVFIREGEVVTSRDLRTAARGRSPRGGARAQADAGSDRGPCAVEPLHRSSRTNSSRLPRARAMCCPNPAPSGRLRRRRLPVHARERMSLEELFVSIMGEDRGL